MNPLEAYHSSNANCSSPFESATAPPPRTAGGDEEEHKPLKKLPDQRIISLASHRLMMTRVMIHHVVTSYNSYIGEESMPREYSANQISPYESIGDRWRGLRPATLEEEEEIRPFSDLQSSRSVCVYARNSLEPSNLRAYMCITEQGALEHALECTGMRGDGRDLVAIAEAPAGYINSSPQYHRNDPPPQ